MKVFDLKERISDKNSGSDLFFEVGEFNITFVKLPEEEQVLE